MGDQVVTGNITSNCTLNLVGTPTLGDGKWNQAPLGQVPPGENTTAFIAASRDGAAVGTDGNVTYEGPDGTQFLLQFSDPYVGDNDCTTSVASGSAGSYSYQGTYNQGDACTFTSTIIYNG